MSERELLPDLPSQSPIYNIDEVANVLLRRNLNENFSLEPVDFYAASLHIGQQLMGRVLGSEDLIVDIGGSYGDLLRQAVIEADLEAKAVCVEPSEDAKDWYQRVTKEYQDRVLFVQATGEATGLVDNCAQFLMMHNVIFRAHDPVSMLREANRIVKPGGVIAISTNVDGHAEYRHRIEKKAAEELRRREGTSIKIPEPPATGKYLSDLPDLLSKAGLYFAPEESNVLIQDTYTIITEDRLPDFRAAIYTCSYGLDIMDKKGPYQTWRAIVDEIIEEEVEPIILLHQDGTFRDPVKRGMYTFINHKPGNC